MWKFNCILFLRIEINYGQDDIYDGMPTGFIIFELRWNEEAIKCPRIAIDFSFNIFIFEWWYDPSGDMYVCDCFSSSRWHVLSHKINFSVQIHRRENEHPSFQQKNSFPFSSIRSFYIVKSIYYKNDLGLDAVFNDYA